MRQALKRVRVANRGEIAVWVTRAGRALRLDHPDFLASRVHTRWVEEELLPR